MSAATFFGIDPGPVPGIVELHVVDRALADVFVIQCTDRLAPSLLRSRVSLLSNTEWGADVTFQVEQFVVSRRAGRSSSAGAGEQTRRLIGRLQEVVEERHSLLDLHLRTASQVKAWAADERLQRAVLGGRDTSLFLQTAGMRHARDAARHALFAAVHAGALPDPLSKDWRR